MTLPNSPSASEPSSSIILPLTLDNNSESLVAIVIGFTLSLAAAAMLASIAYTGASVSMTQQLAAIVVLVLSLDIAVGFYLMSRPPQAITLSDYCIYVCSNLSGFLTKSFPLSDVVAIRLKPHQPSLWSGFSFASEGGLSRQRKILLVLQSGEHVEFISPLPSETAFARTLAAMLNVPFET